MRAVNLVPKEARRSHGSSGSGVSAICRLQSLGPTHFIFAGLVVVVALVAMSVLAGNSINNKKATLAAIQSQVSTEQAQAARLSVYVTFVQQAQQRVAQVREVADQRFPWQRTLDQISRIMPASTSLNSLEGTTSGTTTSSSGLAQTGPTFTLAGCANTPNQDGVATLLRRLSTLPGVVDDGFQNSTRQAGCGNAFNLVLSFAVGTASTPATSAAASATAATTTTATTATGGAAG